MTGEPVNLDGVRASAPELLASIRWLKAEGYRIVKLERISNKRGIYGAENGLFVEGGIPAYTVGDEL